MEMIEKENKVGEYRKNNTLKIILILSVFFIVCVLIGLWIQKKFFHSVADINADVYPTLINVDDTLFLEISLHLQQLKNGILETEIFL